MYRIWRPTPLVRAMGLEKALDTPAHIYFKNESVSPVGSHKLNSAIPQAYYCKKQGVSNITTETGAGQWGAALSMAARHFGLELAVYMVKVSYHQKPYRRSIMQTYGAEVDSLAEHVDQGRSQDHYRQSTPSGLARHGHIRGGRTGHVDSQLQVHSRISHESCGTAPDCDRTRGRKADGHGRRVSRCGDRMFWWRKQFLGNIFPFMRHNFADGRSTRFIAAEPASCPKLTRGRFCYDYGDEAGYTPLIPMLTLGHNFAPSNIHAGGLRYHGAGAVVSQLRTEGVVEAVDIPQLETFEAATLFARTEGIIPAPESSHAIAAAIKEARIAKEEGRSKVILFNLSGHGLIDMAAYDQYIAGDLRNYEVTDDAVRSCTVGLEEVK